MKITEAIEILEQFGFDEGGNICMYPYHKKFEDALKSIRQFQAEHEPTSLQTAYKEGWNTNYFNQLHVDCKYEAGSAEYNEWYRGYNDCTQYCENMD